MNASQPPRDGTERGFALIAAAIVAASLVIYWGMPGSGPRYQIASSGSGIVRMDTDSGEMIACDNRQCSRIMAPDRSKTFGPVTIERRPPAEQLPPPRNKQ